MASFAAAADIGALVRGFQNATDKRKATIAVLKHYKEYKDAVIGTNTVAKSVPAAVARAIDEELMQMTKETWRDVAVRQGKGLDHVVPVGTAGKRWTSERYVPGKSDKDFIPRGPRAKEAAQDFTGSFQRKYGIKPGDVDVNALDPTNIKGWPDRVLASADFEKYNTRGGTKWLEQQIHKSKPTLLKFDMKSGTMVSFRYDTLVKTAPPGLVAEDAAGFFSDNMKFRQHLIEEFGDDPRMALFKNSKYDLRNIEAFELAGGKLSDADDDLQKMAALLRKDKADEAFELFRHNHGLANIDDAVRAYGKAMEELTEKMAKKIASNHIAILRAGKGGGMAISEMAASLANMPPKYADMFQDALAKSMPRYKWEEIQTLASLYKKNVNIARNTAKYFDDVAMRRFGVAYDALEAGQKATLHGATDGAESFMRRLVSSEALGAGLGVACAGWAIYDAYHEGSVHGRVMGTAYGVGRGFLELLQYGFPPASAAELMIRLTALGVNLGKSAYKNDVLDTLYEQYRRGNTPLNEIINIQAVLPYYAGGLREMVEEMRAENPKITDAQITERIRQYFILRKQKEDESKKFKETVARFEKWMAEMNINLGGGEFYKAGMDNRALKAKDKERYSRLLAGLFENYNQIEAMLREAGLPAGDKNIMSLLRILYRGKPGDFQKALASRLKSLRRPPSLKSRLLHLITSSKTTHTRTEVKAGETLEPGHVITSVSGAWKAQKYGSPAKVFGPFEVPSGGKLKANILGSPAVPAQWSLGNWNTSLVVYFAPRVGTGYGPGKVVLSLRGQAKDNDLKGEGTWGGPGRITVVCGPSGGSGPLSGSQFAQGYAGMVEVVECSPAAAGNAMAGTTLRNGDRLQSDAYGAFLVASSQSSLWAGPKTDLTLKLSWDEKTPSQPTDPTHKLTPEKRALSRFTLRSGKVRVKEKPGSSGLDLQLDLKGPVDPKTKKATPGLSYTVSPRGTDYEVEHLGERCRIRVFEGAVSVADGKGQTVEVKAGQVIELPGGQPKAFDAKADKGMQVYGLPIDDLPLDDDVAEPAGTTPCAFADGKLTDGWQWQDPDADATVESPEPGTLKITVPDGNNLWKTDTTAPRLLHKVTGDFDLECELFQTCKGMHLAMSEFLLFAPGSYAGQLAGQTDGGLAAHYCRLGGGWTRLENMNKLRLFQRKFRDCPDAPAHPVRVRMTRRGDMWSTYWSLDGKAWNLSSRDVKELPDTLWAGMLFLRVAADRLTQEPAVSTLRSLTLTSENLSEPEWDFVQADGAAAAQGKTVELKLDGSKLGSLMAASTKALEGDVELIVRVDPGKWDHKPGQNRHFNLGLNALDEKNRAYIGLNHHDSFKGCSLGTDLMIGGKWGHHKYEMTDAGPVYMRIARQNGKMATFTWREGEWTPLGQFGAGFAEPVYIVIGMANTDRPKTPADMSMRFAVERALCGAELAAAEPWLPPDANVFADAPLPKSLALPKGLTARAFTSPFSLGRAFFDKAGNAYFFSAETKKAKLIKLDRAGRSTNRLKSDALKGRNSKAGVFTGDELLMTVDGWSDGGTILSGLYLVKPDGTHHQWKLGGDYGDLFDIIPAPDGGWLFVDASADNIFHLTAEGQPERALITKAPRLAGLAQVAYDPQAKQLYALNQSGEYPFGGPSAVYRVDDGAAKEVLAAPKGVTFHSMGISPGGVLPQGLYTLASDGNIASVTPDGKAAGLKGLSGYSLLRFGPTGDLVLVGGKEGKSVLQIQPPAADLPPGHSDQLLWEAVADSHVYAHGFKKWNVSNWGAYEVLSAGSTASGGDKRSYIKFAMPAGFDPAAVGRARLRLYHYANAGEPTVALGVHQVTEEWVEGAGTYPASSDVLARPGELTWKEQPAFDREPVAVFEPGGEVNKFIEVDVTELVHTWLEGGANHGLVIAPAGELPAGADRSGYSFFARERGDADKRPVILIEPASARPDGAGRGGRVRKAIP